MYMVVLIASVSLVIAAAVALALSPKWRRSSASMSRLLRLTAVGAAIVTGLAVLPLLIDDQAGAAGIAIVIAPPAVLTLLGAVAPLLRPPAAEVAVTWTVTVLMFAYVIVYGLGVGMFYLPTALVLLGAAVIGSRTAGQPATGSGTAL
jgi:hypothetical protein